MPKEKKVNKFISGDPSRDDSKVTIPFLFNPMVHQIPVFRSMQNDKLRGGLVWHRRAGKDKTCFNLMISKACQTVGAYYYIFPLQNQGRKALWEAMDKTGMRFLDHVPDAILDGKPHDTDMKLRLWNGSIIQVIGSDNAHAIRGTNPRGVVFSEFSYHDPISWDVIRPILNENGGWALFNFTPFGENHAYDLYMSTVDNPRWFWSLLTVDDTAQLNNRYIITPTDIEEERKSGMDEEMIQQEYYCSFAGSKVGSYFGRLMMEAKKENRLGNFSWDSTLKVYTAWDVGIKDSTAIWFYQIKGNSIFFIDYYENVGEGIDHYLKYIISKRYTYDKHFFPHDIKKRDFTSGRSAYEVAVKMLGVNNTSIVLKTDVQKGIEAARTILPRCYFDVNKCDRGIAAIKNYHKKWDEKRRAYSAKPVHDWSSNGTDAFRYFALSFKDIRSNLEAKRRFAGAGRRSNETTWMGS